MGGGYDVHNTNNRFEIFAEASFSNYDFLGDLRNSSGLLVFLGWARHFCFWEVLGEPQNGRWLVNRFVVF